MEYFSIFLQLIHSDWKSGINHPDIFCTSSQNFHVWMHWKPKDSIKWYTYAQVIFWRIPLGYNMLWNDRIFQKCPQFLDSTITRQAKSNCFAGNFMLKSHKRSKKLNSKLLQYAALLEIAKQRRVYVIGQYITRWHGLVYKSLEIFVGRFHHLFDLIHSNLTELMIIESTK